MVEVEHALIAQKEEFQMRKVNLRELINWRDPSLFLGKSSAAYRGIRAKRTAVKRVPFEIWQILERKWCQKS